MDTIYTSLGELATKFKIPKSQLAYYNQIGLLKPVARVGKMDLYDKENTEERLKLIHSLKKKGLKLEEIKAKCE